MLKYGLDDDLRKWCQNCVHCGEANGDNRHCSKCLTGGEGWEAKNNQSLNHTEKGSSG